MPRRASPAPAAVDWRSPRAVSSRSASGLDSWGTASPCRRSHSCCATARSLAAPPNVNADQAGFGLLARADGRPEPDFAVRRGPAHAVALALVMARAQPVDAPVV